MPLKVENVPGWNILAWRYVGPYAGKMAGFTEMLSRLPRDFVQRGWGPVIGVYQSDPAITPARQQVYLAGCAVPEKIGVSGLQPVRILPQRCAIHRHVGPYEAIPEKFERLFKTELRSKKLWPAAAPPFEIYHDDPGEVAPNDLRTDLCVPLKA
ncbi:GyrI-like domain-containing protein [Ruegeria sp. ANG-R]|uniref:AraC family transcriptional regulator n=1 Tax=Ruegeria sp. ANG-R TaxID=1577903 RepID=UPI00187C0AE4|nr:GyrI-like domain-containing protein [Ruegeria sp. ANG-R]